MSNPLEPRITEAGLAGIWRATNDGVSAQITHIALGDAAYEPDQSQTKLRAEKARYPISDGKRLSASQIHVTAVADDAKAFWVREVGFFLSDGTLLAVWSDPKRALAYKSPDAELLLAYDLALSALPPGSVTIESSGAGLNLTMAAELAALATAQISEQLRGVGRDDALAEQQRAQLIAGRQIAGLLERMSAAEQRQRAAHEDVLCTVIANSTAVINLQHLVAKTTLGV
ncbi:phage tail-collar fiber domain-containing protein [Chromobacterium amazonense]|uniref:phage tail-collar fiber domain-containing protein n=1 Tax=Chromobacterium amazonense TaxID=1382803 RepID=UPI003F79FA78